MCTGPTASTTRRGRGQLDLFEANGFGNLPVCVAKTHLSISSDPTLKGAPTGWRLPVREVRASAGAGFIYLDLRGHADHARSELAPRGRADRHRRTRQRGRPLLTIGGVDTLR